jgi:hypothetical protein
MPFFVVTLEDMVPSPRSDGLPWTTAKISEGPLRTGPWTLIETISLASVGGVDTDPREPMARELTTTHANLSNGWYTVQFFDAALNFSVPSDPIQNTPPTSDVNYRPTVSEVANLLLSRTVDDHGNRQNTFNSLTTPNGSETYDLIQDTISEAYPYFGTTIPDAPGADPDILRRAASRVIAYGTAALIELTHFPEQVASGTSPYKEYRAIFEMQLEKLGKTITDIDTDDDDDIGPGSGVEFNFPADAGGMVGWGSRW